MWGRELLERRAATINQRISREAKVRMIISELKLWRKTGARVFEEYTRHL